MINYVVGISIATAVLAIIIRGFTKKDAGCGCGCGGCSNTACHEARQEDSLS